MSLSFILLGALLIAAVFAALIGGTFFMARARTEEAEERADEAFRSRERAKAAKENADASAEEGGN